MIVTTNLNPTIDFTCPVEKLIPGSVLRSKNISHYPGGKGANVSRAVAAMGGKTVSAGFCGSENFHESEIFLKKHGVIPSLTKVKGRNRTCLLINDKNKETVINSESSLNITAINRAHLLRNLKRLSKKASVIVFSGSLPTAVPASFYASCIRAVKKNCRIILDTSGAFLKNGMKARPHIVKINESELQTVFGTHITGIKVLKNFVKKLALKYDIKTLIVTLGKDGSLICDNGKCFIIPALKQQKSISSVGCGDAYAAGLAYGIDRGCSIVRSCLFGTAAAAANLAHEGACFFKKKNSESSFFGVFFKKNQQGGL